MEKVLVAGACGYLIRTFTSQKIYGPVEFLMTALSTDNVAPAYGSRRLEEFFRGEAEKPA